MSFAEQFGKGFQGSMAAKDKDKVMGGSNAKKDEGETKFGDTRLGRGVKAVGDEVVKGAKAVGSAVKGVFKKGGAVPKTGNYKLHKGETVVPAGMARGLERLGKKGPQKIKPKKVSLGKKGSFTIKHPGAFKAAAKRAGMGTKAYAQKKKSAPGVLGRRARSALGLMAMGG